MGCPFSRFDNWNWCSLRVFSNVSHQQIPISNFSGIMKISLLGTALRTEKRSSKYPSSEAGDTVSRWTKERHVSIESLILASCFEEAIFTKSYDSIARLRSFRALFSSIHRISNSWKSVSFWSLTIGNITFAVRGDMKALRGLPLRSQCFITTWPRSVKSWAWYKTQEISKSAKEGVARLFPTLEISRHVDYL